MIGGSFQFTLYVQTTNPNHRSGNPCSNRGKWACCVRPDLPLTEQETAPSATATHPFPCAYFRCTKLHVWSKAAATIRRHLMKNDPFAKGTPSHAHRRRTTGRRKNGQEGGGLGAWASSKDAQLDTSLPNLQAAWREFCTPSSICVVLKVASASPQSSSHTPAMFH